MNSQHYFKKLEKFAVCAFQAEKGCIEVEEKSYNSFKNGVWNF